MSYIYDFCPKASSLRAEFNEALSLFPYDHVEVVNIKSRLLNAERNANKCDLVKLREYRATFCCAGRL